MCVSKCGGQAERRSEGRGIGEGKKWEGGGSRGSHGVLGSIPKWWAHPNAPGF